MVRELAEPLDQQVAVLGGTWGTMVQSKQLSAADYRRDGHHRDTAGDRDLLNLNRPDIALRTRRRHLHPNVWPWPQGPPSITGTSRRSSQALPGKSHDQHRSIVACNYEP
jgi:hypothetical protein